MQKANLNLENLLEATKACKRQEVSQLNKIHAETLKVGLLKQCFSLQFLLSHFISNGIGTDYLQVQIESLAGCEPSVLM